MEPAGDESNSRDANDAQPMRGGPVFGERRHPESHDIPNYELLSLLGAGGFGQVWLAREELTDLPRAIKVLDKRSGRSTAHDLQGVRRYQPAAQNHPHLLQILMVGQTADWLYYVMPLADPATPQVGAPYRPLTLRARLEAEGRRPPRAALELVRKILRGADHLHAHHLRHCDLKPENVLIVEGEPQIGDVGLVASLDDPPPRVGTPAYLPPGGGADDVYAAGVILYELLTGYSARQFPRLPGALLQRKSSAIIRALRVMDQACDPDERRRYASAADMLAAVNRALRRHVADWLWSDRTGRERAGIVAGAVLLAATLGYGGDAVHARVVPRCLRAQVWTFAGNQSGTPRELSAADRPHLLHERAKRHAGPYPYVSVGDTVLAAAGAYYWDLAHPTERFVLDAHLRFLRPWGHVSLGVAGAADGSHGLHVGFVGQADGEGLSVCCGWTEQVTVAGSLNLNSVERIYGHPQPGVEYLVRLTHCGEGLVLALWPLSRPRHEPIVRLIRSPNDPLVARYLTMHCSSPDPLARVELCSLRLAEYSIPPESVFVPHSDLWPVAGRARPAWVPPLAGTVVPAGTDLLSGEFHPYSCGSWRSVGNWSWWWDDGSVNPRPLIRCVPGSTQRRADLRSLSAPPEVLTASAGREPSPPDAGGPAALAAYEGWQLLRCDLRAYGDFEAEGEIVVGVPRPGIPDERQFFISESASGRVGLVFHLQDTPQRSECAWGRGYALGLDLHPSMHVPRAVFLDLEGLRLGEDENAATVNAVVHGEAHTKKLSAEVWDEVLAADGFRLGVRVRGRELALLINRRSVMTATAPEGGLRTGRMALFVDRLMAEFKSLRVRPLEPDLPGTLPSPPDSSR